MRPPTPLAWVEDVGGRDKPGHDGGARQNGRTKCRSVNHLCHVITGLVPVIPIGQTPCFTGSDGRDKPGHDVSGRHSRRNTPAKVKAGTGSPIGIAIRAVEGETEMVTECHDGVLVLRVGIAVLGADDDDPEAGIPAPLRR